MQCEKTFIMGRCTIYINGINITTSISNKQNFVITCILNNTFSFIKNNFITFATQLTNTNQIAFQIFNQTYIFNESWRYFINNTNSKDLSLWIVSKGKISTIFNFGEAWNPSIVFGHMPWTTTVQLPFIFLLLQPLQKKSQVLDTQTFLGPWVLAMVHSGTQTHFTR